MAELLLRARLCRGGSPDDMGWTAFLQFLFRSFMFVPTVDETVGSCRRGWRKEELSGGALRRRRRRRRRRRGFICE